MNGAARIQRVAISYRRGAAAGRDAGGPVISGIVGRELLPTYDYCRLYREGDVCRVHFDRLSCEHGLSLTLAYSDGQP